MGVVFDQVIGRVEDDRASEASERESRRNGETPAQTAAELCRLMRRQERLDERIRAT